jgi:hypothetical protein
LRAREKQDRQGTMYLGDLGASGDTELFEKHSNINGFWLSDNKISCL